MALASPGRAAVLVKKIPTVGSTWLLLGRMDVAVGNVVQQVPSSGCVLGDGQGIKYRLSAPCRPLPARITES